MSLFVEISHVHPKKLVLSTLGVENARAWGQIQTAKIFLLEKLVPVTSLAL